MKKEFKFSVAIIINKNEKYIEDCIKSIINQTIGFKNNIEIIIVDSVGYEESIHQYINKFPNNIIYMKSESKNISKLYNMAVYNSRGNYINFMLPEDTFSKNVFEGIDKYLKNNVAKEIYIPKVFLNNEADSTNKLIKKVVNIFGDKEKNEEIDLTKTSEKINFNIDNCFYNKQLFNSYRFDENLTDCEQLKFKLELYNSGISPVMIAKGNAKYKVRNSSERRSETEKNNKDKFCYLNVCNTVKSVFGKNEELEVLQKELIIRTILSTIRHVKKDYDDYEYIFKQLSDCASMVDTEYILNSKLGSLEKVTLLKLKEVNLNEVRERLLKGTDKSVDIKFNAINKNNMVLDIIYNTCDLDNVELILKDRNKNIILSEQNKQVDSAYNSKFGLYKLQDSIYAKFNIPMTQENVYKFYLRDNETKKEYLVTNIKRNKRLNFTLKGKIIRMFKNGYSFSIGDKELIVKRDRTPNIVYIFQTILAILKNHQYLAFARIFNKRNKKYYIVQDRPEKAGDNGEALFKYICDNCPEIAKYTYFAISNFGPDYYKMKKIGKVVRTKSLKHKIIFMNAKAIFTSHTIPIFINAFDKDKYKYYADLFNFKLIWLQHGITQNDISATANRFNNLASCFITATTDENKEVRKDKYFLDEISVPLTGFSRFDKLHNNPQNIISIIPTWRRNLSGKALDNGFHEEIKGFEESDYYKNYSKILMSDRLNKLLKDNNYTLKFLLHPGMLAYAHKFNKFETENIKIISPQTANYTELFATSKLLITDYSSVFFDFAYLKKPEIYFQFDREEFYSKHYNPGYFNIETDGFGDILTSYEEVIDKIEYYFNNDFKIEDKYLDRINNTFKYLDTNNSKRIIEYVHENIL